MTPGHITGARTYLDRRCEHGDLVEPQTDHLANLAPLPSASGARIGDGSLAGTAWRCRRVRHTRTALIQHASPTLVTLGAAARARERGRATLDQDIDVSTAQGAAMLGMPSVLAALRRELILATTQDAGPAALGAAGTLAAELIDQMLIHPPRPDPRLEPGQPTPAFWTPCEQSVSNDSDRRAERHLSPNRPLANAQLRAV